MRRLNVCENLTQFVLSKPPTCVFLLCLVCFVGVLMSLANYITVNEVRNPDVVDWNTFNEQIAQLDYCIHMPGSASNLKELAKTSSPNKPTKPSTTQELRKSRFSYDLTLAMDFSGDFNELKQIRYLHGQIDSFLIGLEKFGFLKEPIDVIFQVKDVQVEYNDKCRLSLLNKQSCTKYLIKTCATLSAPRGVFPNTRAPKKCYSLNQSPVNYLNSTFVAFKETPQLPQLYWCSAEASSSGIGKLVDTFDPNLSVFISLKDKQIIVHNLIEIIIMLIIYILLIISYGIYIERKKNMEYAQVSDL